MSSDVFIIVPNWKKPIEEMCKHIVFNSYYKILLHQISMLSTSHKGHMARNYRWLLGTEKSHGQ